MRYQLCVLIFSFAMSPALAGEFKGDLVLFPEGCQQSADGICKLGAELTYYSSHDGLTWQTDKWQDGNGESGTTDGASIPRWAQPIIGKPYDESYLKAAIIHNHYTYNENYVRSWRLTHRMFYDALVDLGVGYVKAKTMYFAVYLGGPKWVKLVPGENCGQNCIKFHAPDGVRFDTDAFQRSENLAAVMELNKELLAGKDLSIEQIEARAEKLKPEDFFFIYGDSYTPTGPMDPKASAVR